MFKNPDYLLKLAYLCDIFAALNQLNSSLQGPGMTIFDAHSKIKGMKNRLKFYVKKLMLNDLAPFPNLQSCLKDCSFDVLPLEIVTCIKSHLEALSGEFQKYFPEENIDHEWVLNPFVYDADNLPEELTTIAQEELISLAMDVNLKQRFKLLTPQEFWLTAGKQHTELYQEATKMFLRFATSYLCEKGFSTLIYLKNKYRSRLEVEHDMRIKLSNCDKQILENVINVNHKKLRN